KRPMMGAIAARLADRVIITDDNPRSEDPAVIRQAILAACPGAREIGDRRAALRPAAAELAAGDPPVIRGTGHSTGPLVRNGIRPFDDAAEAAAAVAETTSGETRTTAR